MQQRGFEIVSRYQEAGLQLPQRATKQAAGYDFAAAEDFTLPSIWRGNFLKLLWQIRYQDQVSADDIAAADHVLKPYLVPTGIKAYMQPGEYLQLANRSSNPLKHGLVLPNGVGVVDADYYNNPKNEGEIFFQLVNCSTHDIVIKKGERLGQGIFMSYLQADQDNGGNAERTGGFGSSGR